MARNFDNQPDLAINRIVEGTTMNGDIISESNIRIDGKFIGTINTKGRLVVGPSGVVEGTVQCQNSEIEGLVKGKIAVLQLLSLKASAKIEGDIYTDKLSIESGATFSGACNMGAKVKDINLVSQDEKNSHLEEKSA